MRSERGFGYVSIDGFVGEGGVFGAVGGSFARAGVDKDDTNVEDDIDDDDDREEPLEVNESSEPDDALRPLCAKYLGLAGELTNGEGDRDMAGSRFDSIVKLERSERGEVSSIK